jgi:hypothetical protein
MGRDKMPKVQPNCKGSSKKDGNSKEGDGKKWLFVAPFGLLFDLMQGAFDQVPDAQRQFSDAGKIRQP